MASMAIRPLPPNHRTIGARFAAIYNQTGHLQGWILPFFFMNEAGSATETVAA